MPPITRDAALHQQLGELIAGMRAIQETNHRLEEMIQKSDEKSDASRASMHKRMDDFGDRIAKVENTSLETAKTVEKMKPTVDEVHAWKQRGIGALFIVGIGASALTFLLTTYFSNIISWLTKTGP